MMLGDYLAAARLKPWAWRAHDCTAFPAIWAGFADALPAYSIEAEAEAMLHAAGGLVPLWERAIAAFPGKAEPVADGALEPGDVGVIELPAIQNGDEPEPGALCAPVVTIVECGAIWTGKRWAFVPMAGGIAAVSSATCLKAWRPLCPKP